MKVALVYDRVNKWGGAERVLLTLHEMFPEAPLYTSLYSSIDAPWAKVFPKVVPSFLNKFKFLRTRHGLVSILMPFAFESFNFDEFDLVISVTSEFAKGIITKPNTKHLSIFLTPTRYLWSGYGGYFSNYFFRLFSLPIIKYLRKYDIVASRRPDKIVAISEEVKARILKYYRLDSNVIYPPVEFKKFASIHSNLPVHNESFYLIVSRLVKYKKVDVAIKAFNELGLPLVVVGEGSQKEYLKSISSGNIIFTGNLTDEDLAVYYNKCKALIFPQGEDFGLVAVEAQVFGKPVIAFKSGGALETVIDGKTGIFFERQTTESLMAAVRKLENTKIDPGDCIENAKKFSKERFKSELSKLIK